MFLDVSIKVNKGFHRIKVSMKRFSDGLKKVLKVCVQVNEGFDTV